MKKKIFFHLCFFQNIEGSVGIQDRIYSKDIFSPAVIAKVNVQAIVDKVLKIYIFRNIITRFLICLKYINKTISHSSCHCNTSLTQTKNSGLIIKIFHEGIYILKVRIFIFIGRKTRG